jgi:ubiquitin-protein ligase E3 A
VIKWFWNVVHEYTPEQKRQLLHFITGSDRVPLKGLSHLPIIVQRNGVDSDRYVRRWLSLRFLPKNHQIFKGLLSISSIGMHELKPKFIGL